MKPAQYDLKVTRGFDFSLPFFIRTRDTNGALNPVNLTGYTLESKLLDRYGAATTVSVYYVDQAGGQIKLTIARAVTATLSSGLRWYFAVIDPSSEKQPYMDGDVLVRDPGSRAR